LLDAYENYKTLTLPFRIFKNSIIINIPIFI